VVVGLLAHGEAVRGQTASAPAAGRDEQAIRDAAAKYKEALDRGDGKMLADLWTADGDIIDEEGNRLKGREMAARVTAQAGNGSRPSFRINDSSLRFITADVALEDGTVEVALPGFTSPFTGRFSATWMRQEGAWKLAALREDRIESPSGNETLQDLDWMVGDWTLTDDRATGKPAAAGPEKPLIEMTVRWNANRTFLLRDMKISSPGGDGGTEAGTMHITQRIGWDPLSRQIRSWVFGSDGSHGEAVWSRDGDSWVARTAAVLPNGSQTSALNIYTYDGKDRCTWRSLPTHVGGEHTPPINMMMIRKTRPGK
jgi:uncharacterized protein (TIGR02246 family)